MPRLPKITDDTAPETNDAAPRQRRQRNATSAAAPRSERAARANSRDRASRPNNSGNSGGTSRNRRESRRDAVEEITVRLELDRITKGAYLYRELDDNDRPIRDFRNAKIGSLYLRKDAVGNREEGHIITVTVQL